LQTPKWQTGERVAQLEERLSARLTAVEALATASPAVTTPEPAVSQDATVLTEIRAEISNLKTILLSRNSFPTVVPSPTIPAWQKTHVISPRPKPTAFTAVAATPATTEAETTPAMAVAAAADESTAAPLEDALVDTGAETHRSEALATPSLAARAEAPASPPPTPALDKC
jgi:hypothetical protein